MLAPRNHLRMTIPTEPIGSIPRPHCPIEALAKTDCCDPALEPAADLT